MSVSNSESDSGSVKEEILLQHELIEASKNKSKSNSKKLSKSPDSLNKNKMLKTEQTKKRLKLKKVTNDSKSDSDDSEKELEIMKTALKQIKQKKAKGKIKTGSTSDNETKNDITLKLSDSTIVPLTTSTPNINSTLIQAASLSTKKGVLQKILADSNDVVKNMLKQGKASTKSNTPTKQLKGILKTSLENIKNNQSDDSDSSSEKLPPSQWQAFQKKELEESSDSEASFTNAISSTQIPQSQKSFDSDNGNKAQPVANRRQSITKNVSFDESNSNEVNDKQNPKTTNDSDSDSDVSSDKAKETNSAQNNAHSSSDTSSSESEDEIDTTTVTNMKQIQKNEPLKTIFANTKSASDSDSDNNSSKKFTQNNNMQTESTKSSSEDDSSESEDESSTNEVTVKPNNISASKNDAKSASEDERDDNEKTMKKNVVNTGVKSVSDKVLSNSNNETNATETSSSADESSDSDTEPEMRKDVKSIAQISKQNQKQSTSSESSSDSDEEPRNSSKYSFISQQKLDKFPQTVFQQKNNLKDISGSDNESSSDVSMSDEVKSPNKTSMQRKKRQREEISASESSDDEPKTRVSKLCDLSIVDTEPLLNNTNSETMHNSLKEYIITNPDLKKIDAKTNLLLEDLNEDEEVWLMQCPKVLAPNLLVGQKLKLDKNVKLKMKVGSNKYECISERSNDLNICVVASESARNQNLAAKIVKPAGTIVIHQMLKDKSPVRIETPDRTKVEAPANLKTRHPIFGANYETKINLDDVTHGKLITAELERRKAEKKALKKKRRESVSRANEKDTSINKDEIIYQLLNQTKSSLEVEKKKSKKRKLSESKEENIAKVQKIDNIGKSEVDSPAKHSTKRKSKKSISLGEDIINDDKSMDKSVQLQESVIENLLETTRMQMKSPQSAEKSKKTKKEKFSNNENSIVSEYEADSSNSAGKKNRKKKKNKEEAKLEGIKANVDEYLAKSNETKVESILASISDTMINDTTVKKKHKKNKHKDENVTMESQNASHVEKLHDNSSIFEYQQNIYNGATKKSHKKNKNKIPEDSKPSTDDSVTYLKVENITEILNNFSTVSEDNTLKKKHKNKKNKDKSVNSVETPAFNDSTKLSVANEEFNVNTKSKKKHTNKNEAVNSTNNEDEEMKDVTPKKTHKHVEESHDKSSELSTSITKKKSKNKSRAADNFDKNQVINDLLSSIMHNTNGHRKDKKSKKQKRHSSDNIANVNEHFVEVKHKKKSKKRHDRSD